MTGTQTIMVPAWRGLTEDTAMLMLRAHSWATELNRPGEFAAAVETLDWHGYADDARPAFRPIVDQVEQTCMSVTVGSDHGHDILEFRAALFPRQAINLSPYDAPWATIRTDEQTIALRFTRFALALREARAEAISLVWTNHGVIEREYILRPTVVNVGHIGRYSSPPVLRGWWS